MLEMNARGEFNAFERIELYAALNNQRTRKALGITVESSPRKQTAKGLTRNDIRKKLDRETVDYLRTLPEIVRRVQGGRIYYTNSFRTQATARYAMGDRPVDIFRDNGIGPEVIGYKRIERCIARWKENPDELSTVDSRTSRLKRIEEEIKYLEQQAKKIRLAEDKEASKQ